VLKALMISVCLWAALCSGPSYSGARLPIWQAQAADSYEIAQDQGEFAIKPSEAALIAKNAYPDAKVLGVKLLPSGEYAVTLKIGGSVQRVLVNATSGALG
jgi:hypothetical protein